MQSFRDYVAPHWKQTAHPGDNRIPRWTYVDDAVSHDLLTVDETADAHKLKFVKASDNYRLADLMAIFDGWAFDKDTAKPQELEDDALFSDAGGCLFRALTHRALAGKPSIYQKYGYVPDFSEVSSCHVDGGYTVETYNRDLKTLAETPASIWSDISAYIRPRRATNLSLSPGLTLGATLEDVSCDTRRMAYNDINVALRVWRDKGDAPTPLRQFLRAMCAVEVANRHMVKRHNSGAH
jgi:hypothetical protein